MDERLFERLMRTVIKGQLSGRTKVTDGVPQGSVLASIMFLIYINDVVEEVSSYTNLFADDTNLLRKIRMEED